MIYEEFVDFLSREVSPQAVIEFRPSSQNQARFEELIAASKSKKFSRDEQREIDQFLMLEHVMQLLKAKAHARQNSAENS